MSTNIKVELLSEDLENDIPTFHQSDKCGEVFVTKRGIFSCFCIVCKQNFEEINHFTEHILTLHLDLSSAQNNLFNIIQNNDVKVDTISKSPLPNNLLEMKKDDVVNINTDCLKMSSRKKNVVTLDKNVFDPLNLEYEEDIKVETESSGKDYFCEIEVSTIAKVGDANSTNSDEDGIFDFNENEMEETFPFKCDICNKSYKLKNAFVAHKMLHENVIPSCSHCGKNFEDKQSFKRHNQILCAQRKELGVKNTSKELEDIKCKYCPKIFKRYSSLKWHEDRHLNSPFKCEHCQKNFMRKHLLRDHLRTHTGERPFKCEYCPAAFGHVANFKRHTLIHVGEKTYICTFGCGKAFYMERERTAHERTHTGEKPYMCELCGRYFSYYADVRLHKKRIHMDRKHWSHKCDQCTKVFATAKQLREHNVVHTGEKPFACDQCPGRFSKASGLREHKKLHSGVKKHVCSICNKAFAQTAGLYGHMKSHGIIKENTELN